MMMRGTRILNCRCLQVILAAGLLFFPAVYSIAAPLAYPVPSEEERPAEAETVANWSIALSERRPTAPSEVRLSLVLVSPFSPQAHAGPILTRAASVDPFRNGLGSPYRC
jgi:hypothetical protein